MTRSALVVKERDREATVERAFLVRSTQREVQRLAGCSTPSSHPVYVLEV